MDPSSTSPAAPAVSSAADPDATQVEESKPAAAPPAEEAPTASEVDKPQAEPEQAESKPNGDAEHEETAATDNPPAQADPSDDTEMKDAPDSSAAVEATPKPVATPANGTPASVKRGGNGGSTKKKNSVPEHKSKKLQKKKSRPLTNLEAEPGQYYFARMKGHPPWPSIICDEAMLPVSLLTTRPVTARLADGSYKKEEYADGGKRAHERTFPVMFLYTNEFAWIPNTELTPLDPEDDSVKTPVEKGKSKTLLFAYATAAENHDLSFYKTMLADHQKALAEDQAEKEERAARKAEKADKVEKAEKVKKTPRKSMDTSALAEDEMDVDEDDSAEKPKTKKRKKAEDSEGDEKPAKTPKTPKLKLSEPKPTPSESSTKKKAAKPKAKVSKSSSDDDNSGPKTEEPPLTPEAALGIKERKVLYFRHKLQRSMLNRESMPKEDEMKAMSDFLSELQTYPDLEASIIRKTKIHKVLKNIIKLNSIPLEEEFHFKDRSRDLLNKWTEILANDPSGGGAGDHGDGDEKGDDSKMEEKAPTTNGTAAPEKKAETENGAVEAAEAAAPEPEPREALENKIGTTVEGEKEAEKPAAEEKIQEKEKTAEEKQTDGPAIESQPEAEYKPPASTGPVAAESAA